MRSARSPAGQPFAALSGTGAVLTVSPRSLARRARARFAGRLLSLIAVRFEAVTIPPVAGDGRTLQADDLVGKWLKRKKNYRLWDLSEGA